MPTVQLTIIGKPECHLCDVAQGIIDGVVGEFSEHGPGPKVTVQKLSILDDPKLHDRFWELIPVVLINGVEHANWRVDASALRAAILEA